MAISWKRYVKDLSPAYDYYLAEIKKLTSAPDFLRQVHKVRDDLSVDSNVDLSDESMIEFLAQYAIVKPIVTSIYSQEIPILRELDAALNQIVKFDGLDKCYTSILEEVKAIEDYKEKDLVITSIIETIFKSLKGLDQEKYGIVYTPPEVVDFINRSVQEILEKEFGVKLTDESVKVVDPFAGTGIFFNRMLQDAELVPDEALDNFYNNQICAFEIMPLSCLISKLSLANTYNKRSGKVPSVPVVRLMDTFAI